MPEAPDSPEANIRMLLEQAGVSFEERLRQWLDAQTFVGGKRVAKQSLPGLPDGAAGTVHQVKVSLHGAKPPVWRRLEIPSAMTLDRVHGVLQTVFGWWDVHLHSFETVCGEFGAPDCEDWADHGDETGVALAQVAAAEKARVSYVYDFGDDWRHDIVVEKIRAAEAGVGYPRCTGGKGSPPGEDGGGIWVFNAERAADGTRADVIDARALTAALTADRLWFVSRRFRSGLSRRRPGPASGRRPCTSGWLRRTLR